MPEENLPVQNDPVSSKPVIQPSSLLQKVKSWVKNHPKHSIGIGLVFTAVILSSAAVLYVNSENAKEDLSGTSRKKKIENASLLILKTSPSQFAKKVSLDQKITFTFNDPVKTHILEHSFRITPDVKGTFSKGESANELVFTPLQKFSPGSIVSVSIDSNLRSVNGRKLRNDFFLSFNSSFGDNQVAFANSNLKLFSAEKDSEAKLSLQLGSEVGTSVDVSIYQSTIDDLIKDFIYQKQTKDGYNSEEYIGKVDTNKLKLVEAKTGLVDKDVVKFKGSTGIYYLEAINSKKEKVGSLWLTFTSKGLLFRQDDQKAVLGTQDLEDPNSDPEVQYTFYNLQGKITQLLSGTVSSVKEIPFDLKKRIDLIVGRIAGESIVVPISVPQTQAEMSVFENLGEKNRVFLYTDRSIYKKGDVVKYRGLVRSDNDAIYKLSSGKKSIKISASRYINNGYSEILNQKVDVKEGGVFYGEFTTNDNFQGEGQYIQAEVVGDEVGYSQVNSYFDVIDYKKPTFELQVNLDKVQYFAKDKVRATIIGKTSDGKPLANTEVNYGFTTSTFNDTDKAVFNENFNIGEFGMCGGPGDFESDDYYVSTINANSPKVKLNSEGMATVSIDTAGLTETASQNLVVVALKKDSSGVDIFGAGKATLFQGDVKLLIRSRSSYYLAGEELSATFYAEARNGEKIVNKEFSIQTKFTSYDQTQQKTLEELVTSNKITTNSDGVGIVKQKLNFKKMGAYLIRISGNDSAGREVNTSNYFTLAENTEENSLQRYSWSGEVSSTQLLIVPDKNSYKIGDKATLKVEAPASLKALMSFERGRIYKTNWIELSEGSNEIEIDLSPEFSPTLGVVFSFFKDGRYYSEGVTLNVPTMHKLLKVGLTLEKEKFLPAEKAKLNITVNDYSGNGVPARLSVNVVDKALANVSRQIFPSIHSAFYFHRKRTTNASSSLTPVGGFWGVGRSSGGPIPELTAKTVDNLYWNPSIQTDANGKASLEIPLNNLETTWKILVYASTDDTNVGQDQIDLTVAK